MNHGTTYPWHPMGMELPDGYLHAYSKLQEAPPTPSDNFSPHINGQAQFAVSYCRGKIIIGIPIGPGRFKNLEYSKRTLTFKDHQCLLCNEIATEGLPDTSGGGRLETPSPDSEFSESDENLDEFERSTLDLPSVKTHYCIFNHILVLGILTKGDYSSFRLADSNLMAHYCTCISCSGTVVGDDLEPQYSEYSEQLQTPVILVINKVTMAPEQYIFDKRTKGLKQVFLGDVIFRKEHMGAQCLLTYQDSTMDIVILKNQDSIRMEQWCPVAKKYLKVIFPVETLREQKLKRDAGGQLRGSRKRQQPSETFDNIADSDTVSSEESAKAKRIEMFKIEYLSKSDAPSTSSDFPDSYAFQSLPSTSGLAPSTSRGQMQINHGFKQDSLNSKNLLSGQASATANYEPISTETSRPASEEASFNLNPTFANTLGIPSLASGALQLGNITGQPSSSTVLDGPSLSTMLSGTTQLDSLGMLSSSTVGMNGPSSSALQPPPAPFQLNSAAEILTASSQIAQILNSSGLGGPSTSSNGALGTSSLNLGTLGSQAATSSSTTGIGFPSTSTSGMIPNAFANINIDQFLSSCNSQNNAWLAAYLAGTQMRTNQPVPQNMTIPVPAISPALEALLEQANIPNYLVVDPTMTQYGIPGTSMTLTQAGAPEAPTVPQPATIIFSTGAVGTFPGAPPPPRPMPSTTPARQILNEAVQNEKKKLDAEKEARKAVEDSKRIAGLNTVAKSNRATLAVSAFHIAGGPPNTVARAPVDPILLPYIVDGTFVMPALDIKLKEPGELYVKLANAIKGTGLKIDMTVFTRGILKKPWNEAEVEERKEFTTYATYTENGRTPIVAASTASFANLNSNLPPTQSTFVDQMAANQAQIDRLWREQAGNQNSGTSTTSTLQNLPSTSSLPTSSSSAPNPFLPKNKPRLHRVPLTVTTASQRPLFMVSSNQGTVTAQCPTGAPQKSIKPTEEQVKLLGYQRNWTINGTDTVPGPSTSGTVQGGTVAGPSSSSKSSSTSGMEIEEGTVSGSRSGSPSTSSGTVVGQPGTENQTGSPRTTTGPFSRYELPNSDTSSSPEAPVKMEEDVAEDSDVTFSFSSTPELRT